MFSKFLIFVSFLCLSACSSPHGDVRQQPAVAGNAATQKMFALLGDQSLSTLLKIEKLGALIKAGGEINATITDNVFGTRSLLHEAIIWGQDADLVKFLIDSGAAPKALDSGGGTPLHHVEEDVATAAVLIKSGIDVNAKDKHGFRPLHTVIGAELIGFLVAKGAEVNARTAWMKETPLFKVTDVDEAVVLIENDADVHVTDGDGNTLIHHAVYVENIDLAKLFIEHGVKVNVSNDEGNFPLHYADYHLAELLLDNGAEVNARNKRGEAAIHNAIWGIKKTLVELLISRGAKVNIEDNNGRRPLHNVGSVALAALLLRSGAKLDATDNDNKTALYHAISSSANIFHHRSSLELADFFIDKGADIHKAGDDLNMTPIHKAVILARNADDEAAIAAVTAAIKEHPEQINAIDDNDQTPLYYARNARVAELLIRDGAEVNAVSDKQITPIHYAIIDENMELVALLSDRGANVHFVDEVFGTTLLDVAIDAGNVAIAALLIEKGIEVNNDSEHTYLHRAVKLGNIEMVKLLVEKGAEVDAREYGETALFYAVVSGNAAIVDFLIDSGTDINPSNNENMTPLDYASDAALARLLISKGALYGHQLRQEQ